MSHPRVRQEIQKRRHGWRQLAGVRAHRCSCLALFGWLILASVPARADAPADKTVLEIEILMPDIAGDPVAAQRWRQTFEKIGQGVRIRPPLPGDKPETSERMQGPFRVVTVVGRLGRDGKVSFQGQSFAAGDVNGLKMWLDELQVYGAQGSPAGKPLWGLTEAQFKDLLRQLGQPVAESTLELTFHDALERVPLGDSLRVIYEPAAERLRQKHEQSPVHEELRGLAGGTALAYLLQQQGMGFWPARTPAGTIQLMVRPLADLPDPWPVGWPIEGSQPRNELLPSLYEMVTTGYERARLSDVLRAVEQKTGTRILTDQAACAAKGASLETTLVDYPRKYTAWALIVKSAAAGAHLSVDYRLDDGSQPFVWIYPFAPVGNGKPLPSLPRPSSATPDTP